MRTSRQLQQPGAWHLLRNAAYLRQRAVLILQPLDGQHRSANGGDLSLDVPGPERGVQPDAVPAPKGRAGVFVVAAQLLRQVGVQVGILRTFDVLHRHTFHKNMRGQQHQATCALREPRSEQQRNGCAIAVAEPPGRFPHTQRIQKGRHHLVRLLVHEVHAPHLVRRARGGLAVGGAREDQPPKSPRFAQPLREVLPHGDRPQALMEEHHQRRSRALGRDPRVLHFHHALPPGHRDLARAIRHGRHACGPCSRSRNRKRWILPVAVLGSSGTNSMRRGYL